MYNEGIKAYSNFFLESRIWDNLTYCGIKIFKVPSDLWMFQEIAFRLKPDMLIETGTFEGGSALFYAHLFDTIGKSEVLSIDCNNCTNLPEHKRITHLVGDSISPHIIEQVQTHIVNKKAVWVTLDSDHSKDHVVTELELYSNFVTFGGYLIVEDTYMDNSGYILHKEFKNNGPLSAVRQFLQKRDDFIVDRENEKFGFSFVPGGYLKRV